MAMTIIENIESYCYIQSRDYYEHCDVCEATIHVNEPYIRIKGSTEDVAICFKCIGTINDKVLTYEARRNKS